MPNYAIRVELRGYPTEEQYEKMHTLMARRGFARTVRGTDAKGNSASFNLPHAVYYGSSNSDCASVRDVIVSSVKTEVQKDILVFVVEANTWAIG
jgi:hypothetical protein